MSRGLIMAGVLLSATACGLTPGFTVTSARIDGIAKEVDNEYAFIDLEDLTIDGKDLSKPLPPLKSLETKEVVRIALARQNGQDYTAMVGPLKGQETASVRLGSLFLSKGWSAAWGQWPAVKTTWVKAVAEGSTMAVELDADEAGVQRIYLLRRGSGDTKVQIYCNNDEDPHEPEYTIKTPCHYIELDGCDLKTQGSLDGPAEAFIKYIKDYLVVGGWKEPPYDPGEGNPDPDCDMPGAMIQMRSRRARP